jgi:hypothetical protein
MPGRDKPKTLKQSRRTYSITKVFAAFLIYKSGLIMKKPTILLLLFLTACYLAEAQDQFLVVPSGTTSPATNTTNIYCSPSATSMGIGTATPLSALDVAGGIAVGTYAGTSAAPANGMIVSGSVGIGSIRERYVSTY